jgi:hypothetical protein
MYSLFVLMVSLHRTYSQLPVKVQMAVVLRGV